MNKIKSIFFILFLTFALASHGHLKETNGIFGEHIHPEIIDTDKVGGCVSTEYPILCNADGTYNRDAPREVVLNHLHKQMHSEHSHYHNTSCINDVCAAAEITQGHFHAVAGDHGYPVNHGIPSNPKAGVVY